MSTSLEFKKGYSVAEITETVTATGSSSSVRADRFTSLAAWLNVSAISGSGAKIVFTFEESNDGSVWFPITKVKSFTATGNQKLDSSLVSLSFVRVSWTVTGTTPSITFRISAALKNDPRAERIKNIRTFRVNVPDQVTTLTLPDFARFLVIRNVDSGLTPSDMRFSFDDDGGSDFFTLIPGQESPVMSVSGAEVVHVDGVGGVATCEVLVWN